MRILKIITFILICIPAVYLIPHAALQDASFIPGWHSTIFPAYHLLGTLFTLLAVLQWGLSFAMLNLNNRMPYRREDMAQINLCLAILNTPIALAWLLPLLAAITSGTGMQSYIGHHSTFQTTVLAGFWLLLSSVILLLPQLFWWPAFRRNTRLTLVIIGLNLGFPWLFQVVAGIIT